MTKNLPNLDRAVVQKFQVPQPIGTVSEEKMTKRDPENSTPKRGRQH
jgi:hypothetical protein